MKQRTLAAPVILEDIGTHTGAPCSIILSPAAENTGLAFHGQPITPLNTTGNAGFTEIFGRLKTTEHILASLMGLGVDNADITSDNPECPIFDGSAAPIVAAIKKVGLTEQNTPRRFLKIMRPVEYSDQDATVSLSPSNELTFDIEINYPPPIGNSRIFLSIADFEAGIAPARTFARQSDVDALQKAGYALGATIERGIGIDDSGCILNPEGLRFTDEFVRHKVLDAVGDMATVGIPLLGAYKSLRGGHRQNNALLRKLFSDMANYAIIS